MQKPFIRNFNLCFLEIIPVFWLVQNKPNKPKKQNQIRQNKTKQSNSTKQQNKIGFYGKVKDQYNGKGNTQVKLSKQFVCELEFEKEAVDEFMKQGKLSDKFDPPVLSAKFKNFHWEADGVWAWSNKVILKTKQETK
jgi:hypothetical protein